MKEIEKTCQILNEGGIILYPTDTIWGIGCDATNAAAVQRIFSLKKRAETKSMIILVDDLGMVDHYVTDPSPKIQAYLSQTNQPTTAIYNNAKNLPANLVNQDGTIAIRIVHDTFCNQLIKQLGKPIVSTSANISGEPYPKNFTTVSMSIKNGVDYIVQHRLNDLSAPNPSAIIRLNESGEIERLR